MSLILFFRYKIIFLYTYRSQPSPQKEGQAQIVESCKQILKQPGWLFVL